MSTIQTVYAGAALCFVVIVLLIHQSIEIGRRVHTHWRDIDWTAPEWRNSRLRYTRNVTVRRVYLGSRPVLNTGYIELLCHIAHWVFAMVYDLCRVHTITQLRSRTAQLAIVHLTFLMASFDVAFVANIMGASLSTAMKFHKALGTMAALQATLHGGLHLTYQRSFTQTGIAGITTMVALLLLMLHPLLRSKAYEFFLWAHRTFVFIGAIALWAHDFGGGSLSRLLLNITLYVSTTTALLRWTLQLYHNIGLEQWSPSVAYIAKMDVEQGTMTLKIKLAKPLAHRPGQYLYLTILRSNLASWLQSHPFAVAWSDRNERNLYVAIAPQIGWTRKLFDFGLQLQAQSKPEGGEHDAEYPGYGRVWLGGPYGTAPSYRNHSRFLLMASDHGIFAQLSLLKTLMDRAQKDHYEVDRVVVVWQTSRIYGFAAEKIQEIINMDNREMSPLTVYTYLSEEAYNALSKKEREGGRRSVMRKGLLPIEDFFDPEQHESLWQPVSQKVAVVVSVNTRIRERIRDIFLNANRPNSTWNELEYQPPEHESVRAPMISE